MTPYLHITKNRVRIRSEFIQNNPKLIADKHIPMLYQFDGVNEVIHRHYSGSVILFFDTRKITANELICHAESIGWIHAGKQADSINQVIHSHTKKIVKGFVLGSLKKSFGAPVALIVAAMVLPN